MNIDTVRWTGRGVAAFVALANAAFPVSAAARPQREVACIVQEKLAERLATGVGYPGSSLLPAPRGLAVIWFLIGREGRPSALGVEKTSGSAEMDRAALKIIADLRGLPPAQGRVVAVVQFGGQRGDHPAQELAQELASESQQLKAGRMTCDAQVTATAGS